MEHPIFYTITEKVSYFASRIADVRKIMSQELISENFCIERYNYLKQMEEQLLLDAKKNIYQTF